MNVLVGPEVLVAMSESGPIVISRETVRQQWQAVRELERKAAEERERFNLLAAFLRSSGHGEWVPNEEDAKPQGSRSGRIPAERGTWTSEIMLLIADATEGMGLTDIRTRLAEGTLAERSRVNPNGFYNAISRLESLKEIVKYKGRVFTRANMEDFLRRVEAGEVEDLSGIEQGEKIIDRLANYVAEHPGVASNEIVQAMRTAGMAAGSIYNNLSKAVTNERIRRVGKSYYSPAAAEALDSDPQTNTGHQ